MLGSPSFLCAPSVAQIVGSRCLVTACQALPPPSLFLFSLSRRFAFPCLPGLCYVMCLSNACQSSCACVSTVVDSCECWSTLVCMHTHAHTHVHTHAYTHTSTHVHTHTPPSQPFPFFSPNPPPSGSRFWSRQDLETGRLARGQRLQDDGQHGFDEVGIIDRFDI